MTHLLPRFSETPDWERLGRAIAGRRQTDPARDHLTWLKRCEIAAWQSLKDACEPCEWFIGQPESPFWNDIQAAKAALGEA